MKNTQNYIPALDGLRAVAVLLVLLFHAEVAFIPGGFIGVDVFFCISGFIITKIILRDVNNGDFSLSRFYSRRVARLLPAVIATVFFTLVASVLILGPIDLKALAQSSIYALTSTSNFHFWLDSGYFAEESATKPLLHTWSLGVEEQFYLLWPSLILLLYSTKLIRKPILMMATLSVASLVAALIVDISNPNAAFFLAPFRIFQFGAGALIAMTGASVRGRWADIAVVIALSGLCVIAVLIHGDDAGILWGALTPVIAASAVILSIDGKFTKIILGNTVAIWVGQRSYAIYLAHWPIIVLWNLTTDFQLNPSESVAMVLISIVAGASLHTLVEKPFRFKANSTRQFRSGVLFATAIGNTFVLVVASNLWATTGISDRPNDTANTLAAEIETIKRQRAQFVQLGSCFLHLKNKRSDYDSDKCLTIDPSAKGSFLILGDSYAADIYYMLKATFPEYNFSQITAARCPVFIPELLPDRYKTCTDLNNFRFRYAANQNKFDAIIIAGAWGGARAKENIPETISALSANGTPVILVGARVKFNSTIPRIVEREGSSQVNEIVEKYLDQERGILNETLRTFSPNFIDIYSAQCSPRCIAVNDNGKLLYADRGHFSPLGARYFGRKIRKQTSIILETTAGTVSQ